MALTKHGFKTKFGLNLGEETVEKKRRREREKKRKRKRRRREEKRKGRPKKGMELYGILKFEWFSMQFVWLLSCPNLGFVRISS